MPKTILGKWFHVVVRVKSEIFSGISGVAVTKEEMSGCGRYFLVEHFCWLLILLLEQCLFFTVSWGCYLLFPVLYNPLSYCLNESPLIIPFFVSFIPVVLTWDRSPSLLGALFPSAFGIISVTRWDLSASPSFVHLHRCIAEFRDNKPQ